MRVVFILMIVFGISIYADAVSMGKSSIYLIGFFALVLTFMAAILVLDRPDDGDKK